MNTIVAVRLLDFPLQLHARARQQADAMNREFRLVVEQGHDQADAVPTRLLELSTLMSQRYAGFTEEQDDLVEQGIEDGRERLPELRFDVPRHAGQAAVQLGALYDEADQWCRTGALLTLATSPEIVAYRRWYIDAFRHQCDGAQPVPWTGPWQ